MSKNGVVQKDEIGKEKFKELAQDMKPVLKNMEDILKKHGVECLVSLCISTDGYFNLNVHDSEWEFKRTNSNSKSVIYRCESEEV